MRYTFLLHSDPADFADFTPEDYGELQASYGAYIQSLKEAGVFLDTDWLSPSHATTTISLKDGEKRVQDGPFADTKEQMGGYFAIEVADLDAAIAWAEKCPAVHTGTIEIRPSAM